TIAVGVRAGMWISAGANAGVIIRGKQAGGHQGVAGFTEVSRDVGPVGWDRNRGTGPDLRGRSYRVGPVGVKSPIYGDRITLPIPFLKVSASRQGGFGIGLSGLPLLPLPTPYNFLVRGSASIYVDHPALSPFSNGLLDRAEALGRTARRLTASLQARIEPPARRIATAVRGRLPPLA